MKNEFFDFRPIVGTPPYVEQYELTFKIRSIVGIDRGAPIYRGVHVVRLSLPAGYPNADFPKAQMVTRPFVYHPNWFTSGRWCYGSASKSTEGLGNFVVRMMQTLQYVDSIINPHSPANTEANSWYLKNRGSAIFPTDRKKLPQPVIGGIVVTNRRSGN